MSQLIREALLGDERQIAEVHIAAWRGGYAGLMPDDFLASLSVDVRTERWRRALADHTRRTHDLVAADPDTGEILGVATLGPSRDEDASATTGELWAINLAPAHWGRGVGTALLDAAVERLCAAGFDRATLWVVDGNLRARRFYERRGWQPDGATKVDNRDDLALHEVRYTRSVAAGAVSESSGRPVTVARPPGPPAETL